MNPSYSAAGRSSSAGSDSTAAAPSAVSCCGVVQAAPVHLRQDDAPAEPGFSLRPATVADLAAARDLLAAAALPLEGVEDQFGEQYAVALSGSGKIVGAAGLEIYGEQGLLRSVVVDPAWRGHGIGAALTADRVTYAARRGLAGVYALTTTAADYLPRLGFQVIGRDEAPMPIQRSVEFSSICPSTATLLGLDLAATAGEEELRSAVRARYAAAARQAAAGERAGCGSACCGDASADSNPITSDLYDAATAAGLPEGAIRASLGCGNPTALAELHAGEVVLDLGSGGGIDVILSARRVGPIGKAYGLDMTEEMLELARSNAREAGIENVEFLKGHIEEIPLPDASVDVIISNCVINLSADKRRVLQEAFRVLKPGGRFAVSDIVVRGEVPAPVRRSMELWVGCVAGALEEREFERLLAEVGFEGVSIEPTRIYRAEDALGIPEQVGLDADKPRDLESQFASAFVRATRPRG